MPHLPSPHTSVAPLLACRKKNGGHRPIAVGEVLRRLVSKCLAYVARSSAISLLTPLQLGVSVQGGCEAIVHATTQLMTSVQDNQHWTLLLNVSNAFNSISREAMFVECRRRLPGLSAWMDSCYSCLPLLHLGKDVIHSCCGVQQGDPLGPLGFSLTLQPIVERINAEVPSLALNAWYLDDGTLVGPPEGLSAALDIIERDALGLHLNRSKSLLVSPASVTPRIPPCHQISPSPEEASVSSAAPLVQPPTVKRSCRTGSRRSGSLWPRCMTCKIPNWIPPFCAHASPSPNFPTSSAPPLRATSSRQPGISMWR